MASRKEVEEQATDLIADLTRDNQALIEDAKALAVMRAQAQEKVAALKSLAVRDDDELHRQIKRLASELAELLA